MSKSTVIGSIGGTTLAVWPWGARVGSSEEDIDAVLRQHGLVLLPGTLGAPEFVLGELGHAEAADMAQKLRARGVNVRVVPRDDLQVSARVSMMVAFQMMVAALAMTAGFSAVAAGAVWVAAPLILVGALAAASMLGLYARGGPRLSMAGAPAAGTAEGATLVAAIHSLADALPEHVVRPLLERARALERRARHNPDGDAAEALRTLADELRTLQDEADREEARELTDAIRAARRAARETEQPR